jgi:hypothetical protein
MPVTFNTKRYVHRLAHMSPREFRFRLGQQVWNRWEVLRSRTNLSLGADTGGVNGQTDFGQRGRFHFSTEELPGLIDTLRTRLPLSCARTLDRAECICAHRFDLLGYKNLEFGQRINWHFDPVNKKFAPLKKFYEIPYLDAEVLGDSKIIWELNRHQHFLTLGKAYQLTRNEKFAQEFVSQFYGWAEQNPYLLGINWASSLEVAFRSLSWLWARELFADTPSYSAQTARDVLAALALNGRFVEHNLSYYFARNTHLLGEALALFFIGTLCPELKRAAAWRKLGWKIILQEARHQVRRDGGYFEQSTYYHVYALDMFLHAWALASRNQVAIPEHLPRTIEAMMDYLSAVAYAGPAPSFGDDDGGRLFDAQRNRREDYIDPLSTGAVLFNRGDWKSASPGLTEETLWLLGRGGVDKFDALPDERPQCVSRDFPASGTYLMVSDGLRLSMDVGPFGQEHCGHSHADALSLTLAVDGSEWLTDRGTFTYTGSSTWRQRFRGTAAHNTVVIDGVDQAVPTAPFKWEKTPQVQVEHWWAGKSVDLLVASHNGYSRLSSPVLHRRTVFFLKNEFWLVVDTLLGQGEHSLELNWHAIDKHGTSEQGTLGIVPIEDSRWSKRLTTNWHSTCYGQKHDAPGLRCATRTVFPCEFATLLIPRLKGRCGGLQRLGHSVDGPRGFQYSTGTEIHSWILSNDARRWQLADFASDARLAYVGEDLSSGKQRVVLWEGSFLSLRGVTVVNLATRQSHLELDLSEQSALFEDDALAAGLNGSTE